MKAFRTMIIALAVCLFCLTSAEAGPLRNLFAPRSSCPGGNCNKAPQLLPPAISLTVQPAVVPPTKPVKEQPPAVKSPPAVKPEVKPATPVKSAAPAVTVQTTVKTSLAQSKAEIQARLGRVFHPGGGFGFGRFEGCGFSSRSADEAVRSCCYYGRKQPLEIGVARGLRGWFATVIYR